MSRSSPVPEFIVARLPRYAAPGQPQHVIQRGNNRSAMFLTAGDFQFFRRCVGLAIAIHGCRVHAYVFMKNHVHFLMTPDRVGAIGKTMQSIGRRYVRYFNDRNGRTGTLWEGRYRATAIHTEQYLLTCYRYIELNPVRAGLVTHPAEYVWSSYGANGLGLLDPLVTSHPLYTALGVLSTGRRSAYRALVHGGVDDDSLRAIRGGINGVRVH